MGISNRKGDIAEARVLYEATCKSYYVASMCQDCPYDMVIDRGSGPQRVQVKFAAVRKRGSYVLLQLTNAHRSGKRGYERDQVDVFVLYVPDVDKTYWIPYTDIPNVKEKTYRISDGVNQLAQYEVW